MAVKALKNIDASSVILQCLGGATIAPGVTYEIQPSEYANIAAASDEGKEVALLVDADKLEVYDPGGKISDKSKAKQWLMGFQVTPGFSVEAIIPSIYAKSISESSTTSTQFQQKLRLTFTPSIVGNYEVAWSALLSAASSGCINSRIQLDDTLTFHSCSHRSPSFDYSQGDYLIRTGIFVLENISAEEHYLDLDYCSGGCGSTKAAYIKEAYLVIRKIGS